ncbi:hypothetical protein [Nonomuraea dietziae]|uniref:hypothetical protein n=1 Tax=Nonomuraea dietziae TaxID=65515 RepID=UPI0031D80BFF
MNRDNGSDGEGRREQSGQGGDTPRDGERRSYGERGQGQPRGDRPFRSGDRPQGGSQGRDERGGYPAAR